MYRKTQEQLSSLLRMGPNNVPSGTAQAGELGTKSTL